MDSFQPAGIVAEIANSFYGHLDEKKNIYCLLFSHLMTIKANMCGLQRHAQLKQCLHGEAFSEIPSTQFRF